tara:strand:+ start:218 stop:691 length:474 start_codon:yes stop_codon:yes gene_type:complete
MDRWLLNFKIGHIPVLASHLFFLLFGALAIQFAQIKQGHIQSWAGWNKYLISNDPRFIWKASANKFIWRGKDIMPSGVISNFYLIQKTKDDWCWKESTVIKGIKGADDKIYILFKSDRDIKRFIKIFFVNKGRKRLLYSLDKKIKSCIVNERVTYGV